MKIQHILGSLLSLSLGLIWAAAAQAQATETPVPVRATTAVEREIAAGKTFVATAHPVQHAVLGSAVDGRVIEFNYEEGDRIEEGEAVVQLLTNTINLQWQAALAELDSRRAELEELENGTRPEEIEQLKARMLAAEARQQYLTLRRDRAVELFENRRVTSAEVRDEAVSAADAAEQAYIEAKAAYELAVAGPRAEQIAQARAQVARQKAIADELEDRMKKFTIRTRFTGYLIKKSTEVGAWASQGGAVAEIAHLDSMDIIANVPEHDIPHLELGKEVSVELYALPGQQFLGTLISVTPQADTRARTFPVKIRVKNLFQHGQPVIKGGMMGRVTLQTGERKTALLVPKDAVVLNGNTRVVYKVVPSGNELTVAPVPVVIGVADGSWLEVTGDLKPGEQVVVRGNERLRPGQKVTVLPEPEATAAGS